MRDVHVRLGFVTFRPLEGRGEMSSDVVERLFVLREEVVLDHRLGQPNAVVGINLNPREHQILRPHVTRRRSRTP